MAYASASQGGYGSGPSVIHADASHPDAVSISDAELLFTGHLERTGPDLVLTGHDGHHHIVPGYFSTEHHADLVAPNGARITGDLVDLLAGSPAPGQYAQAQTTPPAGSIGRIEKVVGDVTVMRNGVAVAVHVGDAVYKNDVVQTGADSSAGIGFPDGTALNLVANTRMALNDYVYDPNGTSNDALFNLVQGGFAFVAGKVAHTGDMKIGTPVATMGIRGTAGYALQQVATVNANLGNVSMSFALIANPDDGHLGQYELIDQFGNVIAQVGRTGVWTNVSFQGPNQSPNISTTPMTAANFAIEQALVPALVQILNNINNLNPTPQSGPNSNGSSTPPIFELINLPQTLQQNSGTEYSINVLVNGQNGPTTETGSATISPTGVQLTPIVNWTSTSNGTWEAPANWSDLSAPAAPQFVNIKTPVKVTLDKHESASGLLIVNGAIVNVVSGGALELFNEIANYGTFQLNSSGADPTLSINGTVYLLDSGKFQLLGPTASNLIVGVGGTAATLVNVDNTIIGSGTIGQGDGRLTLINGADGTIEAKPLGSADSGLLVIDTGHTVSNSGLMAAAADGTLRIDDNITNLGTIGANGSDAIVALEGVHISGGKLETQAGGVIETFAGASAFSNVTLAGTSVVDAGAHTVLHLEGSTVLDGTVTFEGLGAFNLEGAGAALTGKANTSVELDNSGTINGAGNIGAGNPHFALVNGQSGVIDANGQLALVIDNDSPGNAITLPGNAISNFGTIEASGHGGLTIDNTTISNAATGHVDVLAGSHIELDNATIVDGFVSIAAGGDINVTVTSTIENATVSGDGVITVASGVTLTLDGDTVTGTTFTDTASGAILTLDNDTTITGAGTGTLTIGTRGELDIETGSDGTGHGATLDGVKITDNGAIDVDSNASGAILTLDNDTIITGAGTGTLTIGAQGELDIETGSNGSGHGATLDGVQVTDSGAIDVDSNASGAILTLDDDTTITGTGTGTLTIGAQGELDIETGSDGSGHGATLDGVKVTDNGAINVDSNASGAILTLDTLDDDTTITGAGTGTLTIGAQGELDVETGSDGTGHGATLDGVKVTDNGAIDVDSNASGAILTLDDDTTITGAGTGTLTIGAQGELDIETGSVGSGHGATLDGVKVTDSGAIDVDSNASGAILTLDDDTTITGVGTGTLTIGAQGELDVETGSDGTGHGATLDGVKFTNNGIVDANGGTLTLDTGNTIVNAGLLEATAGGELDVQDSKINNSGVGLKLGIVVGAGSELLVDTSSLKLIGVGTVTLAGGAITAAAAVQTLENSGNTIEGFGTIGDVTDGNLTLDNNTGTIEATGGTLIIATDNIITNSAGGTLEAATGATLQIDDIELDNRGNIQVDGTLAVDAGTLTLDKLGTVTLAGGAITAAAAVQTLENSGNTIEGFGTIGDVTDGNLTLDNNTGTIEATGGTLIIATDNIITNSAGGTLEAATGATLQIDDIELDNRGNIQVDGTLAVDAGTLTLDKLGTVTLAGGAITAAAAVQTLENSGNTIEGFGTIGDVTDGNLTLDNNTGTIEATGGTLIIATDNIITNSAGGTLEAATGATLQIDDIELDNRGNIQVDGTLAVDAGTLTLDKLGTVTLAGGAITAAAAVQTLENSGNTIEGFGTIGDVTDGNLTLDNNTGTIEATGGTLIIATDNIITNSAGGTLEAATGATLQIDDIELDNRGNIQVDGTLAVDAGTLTLDKLGTVTLAGGAITAAAAVQTLENSGNTIEGFGTIGDVTDGNLTLDNNTGTIEATGGTLIIATDNIITNSAGGTLEAATGATLQIDDIELDNRGNIQVDGTLAVDAGTLTLDKLGTVTLAGGAITAAAAVQTLENSGNTIEGFGTIGDVTDGNLTLDNNTGTIEATGGTLIIATDNIITNSAGGTLEAATGATLQIDDIELDNRGNIQVDGTLAVDAGTLTLDKLGTVTLAGGAITAAAAVQTLENSGNTIEGFGTIGDVTDGNLTLDNNTGTIEATGGTLIIATDNIITNSAGGTLEAATGATLQIDDIELDNRGNIQVDGTLAVDAGTLTLDKLGTVTLAGGAITAAAAVQTLENSGNTIEGFGTIGDVTDGNLTLDNNTGTIEATGGTLIIATDNIITNSAGGTLEAATGATLQIDDIELDNRGNIQVDGTLAVDAGTLTLDKLGTVTLAGGAITAAAAVQTLENSGNTIEGFGTIGDVTDGNLTLDNNTGTIEATGGTLIIATDNIITNSAGGTLEAATGATLQIDDIELDNRGNIQVDGTLAVDAGTLTLDKLGTVTLAGGAITAAAAVQTLENSGNTIEGFGTIGDVTDGNLTLDNNTGTIEATGGTLIIATDNIITNSAGGTLEAATGATLQIDDIELDNRGNIQVDGTLAVDAGTLTLDKLGTVTLAGGAITAAAAVQTLENSGNTIEGFGTIGDVTDGNLTLDNNTGTIEATGGTLIIATDNIITNSAGGTLEAATGATLQIDDIELDNRGNIQVDGTLAVDAGTLTLDKLGTVTLAGGAITAAAAVQTLENSGNTIEGFGTIGDVTDGNLTLDNNTGTIEATGGTLIIATDNIITNSAGGTLEAATGATLQIDDIELDNRGNIQVDGTLAVDAGTLTLDKLGTVTLAGGAITAAAAVQTLENSGNTIEGFGTIGDVTDGNLTLDNNTGTIEATGGTLIIATDNIITNSAGGTLEAATGATLQIDDIELDNRGNIQVDGTLAVDAGTLTLDKLGTVTLAGGAITAAAAVQTLENSGNTIEGFGTIGDVTDGNLTLDNNTGTIEATGGTLIIATGASQITNTGTLEATNSGILDVGISGDGGSINNLSGVIEVGAGSTVNVADAITNGSATITGGTLEFGASSSVNVTFNDGSGGTPYGELKLSDWSSFSGTITGLSGTGVGNSDEVDLIGFTEGTITHETHTGTGANEIFKLTLLDNHSDTITLSFKDPGGTLAVEDVGNDTFIYDPPAAASAIPSVSIAGPGNDNFVFHPGMGAETVANFNPKVDTIELDHFASIHNVQQLASLITTDAQGDAVIELGHHESITLPSVTATQLQAHLHSLVHLN